MSRAVKNYKEFLRLARQARERRNKPCPRCLRVKKKCECADSCPYKVEKS
jgi:hypothetical protein